MSQSALPASGAFTYRDGRLHAEGVALDRLAEAVGTPFYVYSASALESAYLRFAEALKAEGLDALVCYAVKANPHLAVVGTFAGLGAGADVVSEGELRRALAAGVPGARIVFAGVGKTEAEMAAGLDAGILQFNVESREELLRLDEVARAKGRKAPVALRVNPHVDAETHAKITTGRAEDKFGIPYAQAPRLYAQARTLPGIKATGVHMHIGSQITDLAPFRAAFTRMHELVVMLRAAGHNLRHLDIGGGLGIPYRGTNDTPPHPDEYARVVREALGDLGLKVVLEPGRMIVGNAGVLVTRVIYVKEGSDKTFTIVDGAMNDALRGVSRYLAGP